MALVSNLYPPIMPNIVPGFIRTQSCRIYFGLSKYNSIQDIENVQITLTNAKTNISAFKTSLYPTGIKLTNLQYDSTRENDYNYYITISPSEIVEDEFALNQYYKIQLRFTAVGASAVSLTTPQAISTWLSNNLMYFSEWSRSCLLRGVSQPTLTITGLNRTSAITLTTPPTKITGSLTFEDIEEQDYLANYNIKIYLNDGTANDGLVFDSGTVYPNEKNIIDYELLYNFIKGTSYIIYITYVTQCLYTETGTYAIHIATTPVVNPFNLAITAAPNNNDGYIHLEITMDDSQVHFQDKELIIYRCSSKDNFNQLEKIYSTDESFSNITWQDLSIEHGIWYQYNLYVLSDTGETLYTPVVSDSVLCMFEDTFLINNNRQLKLQFNPSITSFKYTVSESQQNTIGSQYPYVKRNGKNYYRTFVINGLISSLVDETDWFDSFIDENNNQITLPHMRFTSKLKEYGNSYNLYNNYESQNNISNYLNPLYEKFFRDAVYDFLYKNEIKLFKSPTEGNILVYLSNISFEPIASLGRILYSFSATATEVDEATFANYIKYDIINNTAFENE